MKTFVSGIVNAGPPEQYGHSIAHPEYTSWIAEGLNPHLSPVTLQGLLNPETPSCPCECWGILFRTLFFLTHNHTGIIGNIKIQAIYIFQPGLFQH